MIKSLIFRCYSKLKNLNNSPSLNSDLGSESNFKQIQNNYLKELILHAYDNVPYWTKIFKNCEVVQYGVVHLSNFHRIPILTKNELRDKFDDLKSKVINKRDLYYNSSGGSTGVKSNV